MRHLVPGLMALCACTPPMPPDDGGTPDSGPVGVSPVDNPSRGIDDTALSVDVSARSATARIRFEPSSGEGASLEVGDLQLDAVTLGGAPLQFQYTDAGRVALGLPASEQPLTVELGYQYRFHELFTGASMHGWTLTWPYFCGNVFPCHSSPADGSTFSLSLSGVPAGKTAVYPERIATPAPAYMLAWTISQYGQLELGYTDAGTQLVGWYREGQLLDLQAGTVRLREVFQWYEKTLGPYPFGPKAGPVSADWGPITAGMEHHPFWHVGAPALKSQEVQAHEAAHGWFGDGVRLECWEDLVLSEGTATYLAARALDVVAPVVGAEAWASYQTELSKLNPASPVWPRTCGAVDVLRDGLFSRAVYIRGAFFYRGVAQKVGAPALDLALSAYFGAHSGRAGTMDEMLTTIHIVTGYDARACAEAWLRSTTIPAIEPCP